MRTESLGKDRPRPRRAVAPAGAFVVCLIGFPLLGHAGETKATAQPTQPTPPSTKTSAPPPPAPVALTLAVRTCRGNAPIAGAAVAAGAATAIAGPDGVAKFSLPPGPITATATAQGFEKASKALTVQGPLSESLCLEPAAAGAAAPKPLAAAPAPAPTTGPAAPATTPGLTPSPSVAATSATPRAVTAPAISSSPSAAPTPPSASAPPASLSRPPAAVATVARPLSLASPFGLMAARPQALVTSQPRLFLSPIASHLSPELAPSQPAGAAPSPGALGQSQAGLAGRPVAGILGVAPVQTRVAGGNLGDLQDSPFVGGPRPLALSRQSPAADATSVLSAGLGPGPLRARDPERTRQAALQFAGELRAAEAAVGLDRVIPQALRRSLLIQGRVARERAQGNLEQAQALESLGRDVGALPTGAGRERRYEFVRSGDGVNVGVRAQDVAGGRVVREQGAATIRYDDAREFFDRLAAPDGRRLDPGRTLAATAPLAEAE